MTERSQTLVARGTGRPTLRRRVPSVVAVVAFLAATVTGLLSAPAASAHAELESSDPANVSTVTEPVERITLRFTKASEPVEGEFAISGPDGPVDVASVDVSDDGRTMTVEPASPLADGRFRVAWAIRAGDTHAMNGTLAFTVDAAAPAGAADAADAADVSGAAEAAPTAAPIGAAAVEPVVAERPATAAERVATVLRWFLFAALLLCIGGVIYLSSVHRGPRAETRSLVFLVRRGAAALVALSALAVLVELSVLDGGSWLATFSPATWADLLGSGHAPATLLRVVGAALIVVCFGTALRPTGSGQHDAPSAPVEGSPLGGGAATAVRVRRRRRAEVRVAPAPLAGLGVALLVASEAFLGHTADTTPRWLMVTGDAVHLLAAGFWATGVLFLLWSLVGRRRRGGPPLASVVARFSGLAVVAVAAVAASGVVMGALILDGPSALVGSSFGRLLLAKTALVLGLVALGAHNRRTLVPAISRSEPDPDDLVRFRRALTAEAGLFGAVLALTAVLVGSSPV